MAGKGSIGMHEVRAKIARIQEILAYKFHDRELIVAALTHPSAGAKHAQTQNYERLEFLGDSILGVLVAEYLFRRFRSASEGLLSSIKTTVVSGATLTRVARAIGIGECIIFGESELGAGSRGMQRALEDVYEAIVAALFLDGGVERARSFVLTTLKEYLDVDLSQVALSPKSELQKYTQRELRCAPVYELADEKGPAHDPIFTSVVKVDGKRMGRGSGPSKKRAESQAASDALTRLRGRRGRSRVS